MQIAVTVNTPSGELSLTATDHAALGWALVDQGGTRYLGTTLAEAVRTAKISKGIDVTADDNRPPCVRCLGKGAAEDLVMGEIEVMACGFCGGDGLDRW